MCVYIRIYTECIWCWQIQWLIWACWSVKSHHSLRGTCRLPWSGSWLRIPDAAPNPVSQPLLSSMVESGRTAEQISLCFPTLAKAAPANTHQHSGTWRQLTSFSSLWAAVSFFCFVLLLLPCVWGGCVRTACYQRRKKWNHGIGFIKQQLLMILTFKSFCIHCWTNCFFLHWWSRVITVIVLFDSIYYISCKLDMFYR